MKNIFSLSELKTFIKVWKFKEDYPWKNIDQCLEDFFIFYDSKWRDISKKNCTLQFKKWLEGGDPKKREEEKQEYFKALSRKKATRQFEEMDKLEENKKKELLEKERIAKEFIAKNPQVVQKIEKECYDKAMSIVKGNEKLAKTMAKWFFLSVAYKFACNQ